MRRAAIVLLSLWLGALGTGAGRPALRGSRPIDTCRPQDLGARIEWREGWDATYKANMTRWEAEIAKETQDRGQRETRLRARRMQLLEALTGRYPHDTAKRVEARSTIADDLARLGLRGRGNYVLKTLVDEFPGRPDIAAAACRRILDTTPWDEPWETEEGAAWVDYAARRLLALHQLGYLAASDPGVVRARQAMVVASRAEGRLMEAAERLVGAAPARDPWWRMARAKLFHAAGRSEEALRRFRDIYRQTDHSDAKSWVRRLSEWVAGSPPTYRSRLGLEIRWEALRGQPLGEAVDRLLALIGEDADGGSLLPWGESRHTSVWASVDRALRSRPGAELGPLRAAGARDAQRRLRAARRSGDAGALLGVYRRWPWSRSASEALLAYGEAELRRGGAGLARRAFDDAMAHGADPAVRARARVGLWLCLAQEPGGGAALAAAFEGIDPESPWPWLGRPTPARAIRERLAASVASLEAPAATAPALAELSRRMLPVLPAWPWPWELFDPGLPADALAEMAAVAADVQVRGREVLVSGPGLLCAFRDGVGRPRWSRHAVVLHGRQGTEDRQGPRPLVLPGAFRPVVAGGRVYTRWGLDASRRCPTALAAFEMATGAMVWSTAGEPAWGGFWPVGDPAVAEGRVYVLVVPGGRARVLPILSIHLACLDAASGRLLWRRRLASQTFTLIPSRHSPLRDKHLDVVHYGNAVAVHDGAVYCLSNLGFVARCDARDGVVEWARSYPRAQVEHNMLRLARRRGSAPLVVGDTVVVVPRDHSGAFALERDTGKLVWDNAFVASDAVIGLAGGALLLRDRHEVAAMDVATGRTRWHRRFAEGIVGRPALVGSSLYVGTAGGLRRVAADTGRLVEQAEWGPTGPMRAFAVRGRSLVGLAPRRAAEPPGGAAKPLNPKAPAATPPLRLPVDRSWTLPRSSPALLVPPPEAKLPGKLYVMAEGTLECLAASARGAIQWQRPVEPGFVATAWAPGTLLFVYPRRVAAVDGATGALRWQAGPSFRIQRWALAGPYLVLRDYERHHHGRRTAVVDVATGKLLWERAFRGLGRGNHSQDRLPHVGWDGRSLHLVGHLTLEEKGIHTVVCRPTDGRITAVRRIVAKGARPPAAWLLGDGAAFYIDDRKVVHELSLGGGPPRTYRARLGDLDLRYLRRFRLEGPWLEVVQDRDRKRTQWILRRGDTGYLLRPDRPGTVRGNTLYVRHDRTLTAIDLPSKRQRAEYIVPPTRGHYGRVLEFAEQGNTLLVVSGLDDGPSWRRRAARVRVDLFDRGSGKHLAGQVLGDVPFWEFFVRRDWRDRVRSHTQAVRCGGVLVVTDWAGVHGFVARSPTSPVPETPLRIAHRAGRPVRLDGRLDEWEREAGFALRGPGGSGGAAMLSHDGERLYLAVACRDHAAQPRRGHGDYGAGDWLEVGVTAGSESSRFGVGVGPRGRLVWEPVAPARFPEGLDGQVGRDPAAGTVVYELAVPLKSLAGNGDVRHLRELGLSVVVWDDEPGRGPVRAWAWGGALPGHTMIPARHERVHLHQLTRDAELAGLALAHELPELPEAWAFFRAACRVRARCPSRLKELHRTFLRRHPRGPAAERALAHLDQLLRTSPGPDPSAEILKLAADAGVAPEARSRYQQLTKAYLSQWVHLDAKHRPATLKLQLSHARDRGRDHRVYWGRGDRLREGEPGTPSRRDGGDLPPPGAWRELRVPLLWLDLHDKPIHAITFDQWGGHHVVWDRTAFGRPGAERVLIDDKLPEGRTHGSWRWVSRPVRSGSRAHGEPRDLGERNQSRRSLSDLKAPVVEHILPPGGPYLSQWVYLDPGNRPRLLTLALHDGADWRFHACWGEPRRQSRYMGPLPKAGSWQELRVPLAWAEFLYRPIRGISFGQYAGRVLWDRTAVVVAGRERVVVDDAMPAGQVSGSPWAWVAKPVRSGKAAHSLDRPTGSYKSHGVYQLEQPITDHLRVAPEQAAASLRRCIPRLGPTEQAWRLFEQLLWLDAPDAQARIERHTWFLRHYPAHRNAVHVLARLLSYHRDARHADPVAAVEAIIAQCKPPARACYEYRRRYAHTAECFLRQWQVLGPFPNADDKGLDTPFAPETAPIDLNQEYDGAKGRIRWKRHESKEGKIDLAALLEPNEHVVGYAACWVHAPRALAASLELGSDDGCKVWLNRKLVFALHDDRSASPRQNVVPVRLRRGANELLVKIEQGEGDWEFYLELVDAAGRPLLDHVQVHAEPPKVP